MKHVIVITTKDDLDPEGQVTCNEFRDKILEAVEVYTTFFIGECTLESQWDCKEGAIRGLYDLFNVDYNLSPNQLRPELDPRFEPEEI